MTMYALRRALLPATLVAMAALLAWVTPVTAAHSATRAANTSGTITGTVVNGSKGNAPAAGQTVTLNMYVSHAQTQNAATTTTDAHGRFSFGGLDGSGSTVYQLEVRYASGDFMSAPIGFASGPVENLTLTVYDTTSDPSALAVTNTTMLFSPPNTKTGLIPIGVFMTFKNSGKLAFVASATAGSGGMPTSLLRFALPPNAQNLTLGAGFNNVQAVQVDKGFAALATIPPGTTQFAYVYYLPYAGTDFTFQFQAVYPTAAVTLLVPNTIFVHDGDYAAKPPVQALGQQYQLLEADNVQPGEALTMRLWNLTVPGEQPDLDQRQLWALAALLALLLALLVGIYLKRGNLAVALGILPASSLGKAARARGSQDHEAERKRLLKMLLALEKQHTAGQLDDAEYQRRRDNTRRKLKALLADSIETQPRTLASERKPRSTVPSQPAQASIADDDITAIARSKAKVGSGAPSTSGILSEPEEAGSALSDTVAAQEDLVAGDDHGAVPAASPRKTVRRRRSPVGGRR